MNIVSKEKERGYEYENDEENCDDGIGYLPCDSMFFHADTCARW